MAKTVRAIYKTGNLRLLEELDLDEGQAVLVTVEEMNPPLSEDQKALLDLLRSWREGSDEDLQDQRETLEFLMKALDEDRLSDRKLFP